MSSVGSSDGSNSSNRQDEIVRRNREDYRKSESDMVKKHQKELRRLNESHYAELENLKANHGKQLEQVQGASNDAISRRDHQYNQEVEKIRDMNRKAMESQAEETQKQAEALRKAASSEARQQKAQSDARFSKLNSDYAENMEKRDQFFKENIEKTRESQAAALNNNREKIEKAFDKNLDVVKDERNQTVANLQATNEKYRQSAEGRFREQQVRHFGDQQRASDSLLDAVQKERNMRVDSEARLREGFEDGLGKMRDRFQKSIGKEEEALRLSRENLQSDVANRSARQIDRLSRENQNMKEANIQDQVRMNHQKNREVDNIAEAYQKNMDSYRQERDEAIRQGNERNHNDIAKVRKELDGQMSETGRFYRGKMEEQNGIQRTAYNNLKTDADLRHEQTKLMADQRVKTIYDSAEDEKQRLTELQGETRLASQRSHQDEMKALRTQLESDKNQAISRMTEQLQKQEVQHADRLNTTIHKYEKQVLALKDQIVRERKLNEENLKRTVEDLQRVHNTGIERIEAQNRERVRQMQAQQDQEVKSLNKRHEDRLDSVLVEVKKT